MKQIFLGVVAPSFVIVPLVVSLVNYKFLNREFKILSYYFITSLIVNVITTVLAYFRISNLFFFHAYTPVEAVFLFLFFQQIFKGRKIVKIIWALTIAFPVYCILNFIFFQGSGVFNTYTHPIEAILFIGLSIYYYWIQSYNHELEDKWTSSPLNWVVSGWLLYFSSTIFLYIFSNFLILNYSSDINIYIWNIHGVIVIITNLLCTLGFFLNARSNR